MMKGLNKLIEAIGEAPARNFLKTAQSELKEGHQELLCSLYEENWKKTAQKVHRLRATANLYASDTLLSYYEEIAYKQGAIEKGSLLIKNLKQELCDVESNIKLFLSQK